MRSWPWCQRSSRAVLPQNQRPGRPRTASGTSVLGRHGSTAAGSSSPSSTPGTASMDARRTRSPSARCRARLRGRRRGWPGSRASTPCARERPPVEVEEAEPQPVPPATARWPSRRVVVRASTSGCPVARKSAQRARSATVLQACPAGAIAPGVLVRLQRERLGEVVDAEALRVRGHGQVRRAPHAEGLEQLAGDDVPPRGAAEPGHRLAEQGEAQVAVVVVVARTGATAPLPSLAASNASTWTPGDALPPRADRFALHPRDVGEQVADGRRGVPGLRHEPPDRVVERQQPVVAAAHHRDRDEGLGDRADPVLRVIGRSRARRPRRRPR